MDKSIVLRIECFLKSFYCKRRFPVAEWTLGDFRCFVQQLFNIKSENLIIFLHGKELSAIDNDQLLCNMENLNENDTIIVDSRCPIDDIDNINKLSVKHQMSDEAYSKRKGTLKEYFRKNKLGKYGDHGFLLSSNAKKTKDKTHLLKELIRQKLKMIEIGMYVKVNEPRSTTRYGEVVYIGILCGVYDEFIGIVFDGPYGDSNGCDGIIRYFDAPRKHATFVRPEYVEVITQ